MSNKKTTLSPEVLSLWDYSKNVREPSTVTAMSKEKTWWICDKGHSWETSVGNITSGKRCPYCSGRKVLSGFNDIATTHPHLLPMWDVDKNEITPHEISSGSRKKMWWTCEKGHSWEAALYNIALNSTGCPFCSGRKALRGFNDLFTTHPELINLWSKHNDIDPHVVTAGSRKRVWWVCSKGHSWEAPISQVSLQSSRCPYCDGKMVLKGFNDLASTHPEVIPLWDDSKNEISPHEVTYASHRKVWWTCEKEHSWKSTISHISSGKRCPYCSGNTTSPGHNDLSTTHPQILEMWNFDKNTVSPDSVSAGSSKKVWWRCNKGHIWRTSVKNVVLNGTRCKKCSSTESQGELDVYSLVCEIVPDEKVIRNDRSAIAPLELDIYIPGKNIAIEFNGLHWHSEEKGKGRWYHYNKWKKCLDAGIHLITIWEDDWINRNDTVVSMIRHKLGASDLPRVYARKTTIQPISYQESSDFLNKYHIQGDSSGTLYLGMFHDGFLIAVSVWKKNKDTLYLDRYATSCIVVGGMGKMLKEGKKFACDNKLDKIVTFSDNSVSCGQLYEKLGFYRDSDLRPDYSYIVKGERKHKFGYRLKRFRNDPDLLYKEGMTERELAQLNNLRRIWDCGKLRWIMDLSESR